MTVGEKRNDTVCWIASPIQQSLSHLKHVLQHKLEEQQKPKPVEQQKHTEKAKAVCKKPKPKRQLPKTQKKIAAQKQQTELLDDGDPYDKYDEIGDEYEASMWR